MYVRIVYAMCLATNAAALLEYMILLLVCFDTSLGDHACAHWLHISGYCNGGVSTECLH